jgi:hypothetical protein
MWLCLRALAAYESLVCMQRTQRRLALAKRDRKSTAEKKAAEQLEDLYRQQQVLARLRQQLVEWTSG